MVSAVVLAAGRVDNAAQQKTLLPRPDRPLLQAVLEDALASKVGEVVCVVSDLAAARRDITIADERLIWLVEYGADGGPNKALIAGLWAIDPKSDGALFLAGNQPLVLSELIDALIERFENSRAPIVAPSFDGQIREPLLFRRELFPELLKFTGTRGFRALLEKNQDKAALIPWGEDMPVAVLAARARHARLREPV